MRKNIFLALAAVAMCGMVACSGGSSETASNEREIDDGILPIVLEGAGYRLELPANAADVTCTPVTDERETQLRRQGFNLIAKPVSVTRNGDEHVQLGRAVTISFAIPEDFPKSRYNELVGVLFTENGPEYKIPDYFALREGVVKFKTSHFCDAAAERNKDKLRERFIDEVAVNGWGRNMNNKNLEPTWREQLNKFANDHCMGENDLVGIAMREVFADKDIVKIGIDIVNAHDMEDATIEQRMQVASENMVKVAESKLLSYFLKKLKEEDTKKKKVIDELKSEKKGETIYKTELEKIDSRRNKIIGVLEDHFSVDNVEKVSTLLGDDPTVEKCYVYACEYVGNFALEQWKSKVEEMVPYISTVKQTAKAVEIWKKFWAATQMQDLYERYEKKADENHGLLDNDMWNAVSINVATPEFLHGMTDAEIKEMIEQRYLERVEINERKAELRKYLNIIESTVDLNAPCLEQKHFDYIQRLTIVNNLIDRFYDELVDKDGELVFDDDGYRRVYSNPNTINEQLCYVVNKYFECYPDRDKFYAWLSKHGYNYGQLKAEYKRLDDLLWKENPENDPDIHIEIKETLGAASGMAKYAGRTICLGTNGKPYMDWYRNIPDEDWARYEGWSTEYPDADSDVKLSQYKAIGMPNQILVYASENDLKNGNGPIEAIPFRVDTTGTRTEVELNGDRQTLTEYSFESETSWNTVIGYGRSYTDESTGNIGMVPQLPSFVPEYALADALSNVNLFLKSKSDDFSFTTSGESTNGDDMARINLTVSGSVDFEQGNGTCTMMATVVAVDRGTEITANFNLTGEILVSLEGEIKCSASGPTQVTSVNSKGETKSAKVEGYIKFVYITAE